MLNEKIKYCRKPLYDAFNEIQPKEEKKIRNCLSGLSEHCQKKFLGTRENRICSKCHERIAVRNEGL